MPAAGPMTAPPPHDDSAHPAGTTWRHAYASGHAGLITKVAEREYVVEVEPPHAAGATFVATVASVQAGIDMANAQARARSAANDWRTA